MKDNWGTYYPNGQVVFDNWGCYSPSGQTLSCESTFRVRASIAGFGSVVISVYPKEKRLGSFSFSTNLNGAETYLDVDFESKEVTNVDMICE